MMKTAISIQDSDLDLIGPSGEILHLEDVASIRAIALNNIVEDTYYIDAVDLKGNAKLNYLCTFKCLNYLMLMIFVEGNKEDKTKISINLETIMTLLAKSRNIGYSEAAGDAKDGELSEDAMEELMKREPNVMLN